MDVSPSERRENPSEEADEADVLERERLRRLEHEQLIEREDRMRTPRAMVFGALIGVALWIVIIAVLVRIAF